MKNYRKYKIIFLTNWQSVLAYRNSFFFWAFFSPLPFFLMYFLWSAIYLNHGAIKGYTFDDLILYFFAVMIVKRVTTIYVEWALNFRIKNGMLSTFLAKPVSIIRYFFATNLSQELMELILSIPLILIVYLIFRNHLSFTNIEFSLYFLISVAMSYILGFLISFILGCIAFWHEEADGFFYMKEVFCPFSPVLFCHWISSAIAWLECSRYCPSIIWSIFQ